LWQQRVLNPVRPLMTLLTLCLLSGIQLAAFGFIGTQIAALRKEVIKVQRENRLLEKRLLLSTFHQDAQSHKTDKT
jgi:hypothetical protein